MKFTVLCVVQTLLSAGCPSSCLLYPQESETRERRDLSGIWNFRTSGDDQNTGFREKWFKMPLAETGPILRMPVPSSFNDITQDKLLREYIGWVWYDRNFFVPARWRMEKLGIVLRFGSAHYEAMVWLNGIPIVNHTGGHLPFENTVEKSVAYGSLNRVTVALNNTLSHSTIPPAEFTYKTGPLYPPGYHIQIGYFDFFNYAGIHRPVWLYTRPVMSYIEDILILTDVQNGAALVSYNVSFRNVASNWQVKVKVLDKKGANAGGSSGSKGVVKIDNPKLWWPIHMNETPGYMYTLRVALMLDGDEHDIYREKFGIRTIKVTSMQFLINGKPFYFTGFGRHEDSDIRGKGVDLPVITKDFNLIDWLGGNSFRTSHYPYAEEIMNECDERGIVVIDECPAVGLQKDFSFLSADVLQLHISMLKQLVARDKNRPSVVLWSVANEPDSSLRSSEPYFKQVVNALRNFDQTNRPLTAALSRSYESDLIGKFMNVTCFNRYFAWYHDYGHTEVIKAQMIADIEGFYNKYGNPVMITEYGADTIAGMHKDPSCMFTEEYQMALMAETQKAFDKMRSSYLVGEMIWNFADFMTRQEVTRVVGNKKGIFTRERQPKAGAHSLRTRYKKINNVTVPVSPRKSNFSLAVTTATAVTTTGATAAALANSTMHHWPHHPHKGRQRRRHRHGHRSTI